MQVYKCNKEFYVCQDWSKNGRDATTPTYKFMNATKNLSYATTKAERNI